MNLGSLEYLTPRTRFFHMTRCSLLYTTKDIPSAIQNQFAIDEMSNVNHNFSKGTVLLSHISTYMKGNKM